MKRDNGPLIAWLIVFLLVATIARADDPPSTTSFSGFIDAAYVWSSHDPENHRNFIPGTGTSGKRANELMLNLAQVQWSRTASAAQPVGFTLALVAGEGTDVVHAGEPDGGEQFRHLHQASLAYRLPSGILLEAGVYPSHIGMEAFYSKDNWNYTRSWLGEFSPYYQTGLKASYAFNERWSGQIHIINGWQIIHDSNGGKSIGTQISYSHGPLSASLNTCFGPELAKDDDSMRRFADVVVLYRVSPRLQLGGSFDLGAQELPNAGDANWRGTGVYARYTLDDRHAFAVRAEEFRDPDGGISGAAQTLREATLTYEVRSHDNLILKLETRLDRSTAPGFADDERTQLLALAGLVVTF